jgi:hypothetical protein
LLSCDQGLDRALQIRRHRERLARVDQGADGGGIGVNSFLWRASLDTLAFLPLASADPFGGGVITDWYSPPETPDERFEVNIFILNRQLRSDDVRARSILSQDWLSFLSSPATPAC